MKSDSTGTSTQCDGLWKNKWPVKLAAGDAGLPEMNFKLPRVARRHIRPSAPLLRRAGGPLWAETVV